MLVASCSRGDSGAGSKIYAIRQGAPHADHSTNPLERLNAKIKRRTDVVGIFPNDAAITRLVGALLLEQSDEWSLQRRYMQLEGLQALADNQTARLSAVVN
jgi:putative transposase